MIKPKQENCPSSGDTMNVTENAKFTEHWSSTTQMNWWGHALSFNVYCIFSFNLIIGDTTVYIKRMYKNRASLALVVAKNKIYKQNQVHTYIHIQST